MKTVLLVAELGGGIGHLVPLIRIADRLVSNATDEDLRVLLASSDPSGVHMVFPELPFRVLAAPVSTASGNLRSHTSSYAEILLLYGFNRPEILRANLKAWDGLLDLCKPDLMIADHSPTAILAARGRLPILHVGTGFTMPPAGIARFPALMTGRSPPTAQVQILETVNQLLDERRQEPIPNLPAILDTGARAVFSLPQFDPYRGLRSERLLGSYHGNLAPMPQPEMPHIFLYAGGAPDRLDEIAQALSRCNVGVSAYLGPLQGSAAAFLKSRGVHVHTQLPDMKEVLRNSSVIVSHGGSGLANAALAAGRPQIIMPIHAESSITASRVLEMDVGLALEKDWGKTLAEAVETVTQVRRFREHAEAEALTISKSGLPGDPVQTAADEALELLR